MLKINNNVPAILIGTNLFVGISNFIIVDNEDLISLDVDSKGQVEVTVKLYDKEDNLVAYIDHNEWISGDPMPWDIEAKYQWLKIRNKPRNILLEINTKKLPIEIRADLWFKKQNFHIDSEQISFNGVVKDVGFINLGFVGLRLLADTKSKVLKISPDPIFGEGRFIYYDNIQKRLHECLKAFQELKSKAEKVSESKKLNDEYFNNRNLKP